MPHSTDPGSVAPGVIQELQRAFLVPNFMTWLGVQLVECRSGLVRLELPVKPEFIQISGSVHGGIIATVADAALACALMTDLDSGMTCSTIEIKVNYLAPVREGLIRCDATSVRRGKRVGVSRGDLFDQDGKMIATALGTFMLIPVPKL